ncbi:hypothetical protein [Roseinatronobacter bogoriensis]|nr:MULTISPECIES: hypothetical protein [Rhodobaca]MBB4208472.1 hypothetical protein [Rhodobaca bogoriensis DSM 18756]
MTDLATDLTGPHRRSISFKQCFQIGSSRPGTAPGDVVGQDAVA